MCPRAILSLNHRWHKGAPMRGPLEGIQNKRVQLPNPHSALLIVLLPFATGLGLVINILTGFSLVVSVVLVATLGAIGFALFLNSLVPTARQIFVKRIGIGALSALLATLLYDLSRLVVARTLTPGIDPFAAWPVFGQLITGSPHNSGMVSAVGFAFHMINGLSFGVAFVLLIRSPSCFSGILWALGLELAMAFLYPSWLRITALQEFLTLSVIGHIVYGASLGFIARKLLARLGQSTGSRSWGV